MNERTTEEVLKSFAIEVAAQLDGMHGVKYVEVPTKDNGQKRVWRFSWHGQKNKRNWFDILAEEFADWPCQMLPIFSCGFERRKVESPEQLQTALREFLGAVKPFYKLGTSTQK